MFMSHLYITLLSFDIVIWKLGQKISSEKNTVYWRQNWVPHLRIARQRGEKLKRIKQDAGFKQTTVLSEMEQSQSKYFR